MRRLKGELIWLQKQFNAASFSQIRRTESTAGTGGKKKCAHLEEQFDCKFSGNSYNSYYYRFRKSRKKFGRRQFFPRNHITTSETTNGTEIRLRLSATALYAWLNFYLRTTFIGKKWPNFNCKRLVSPKNLLTAERWEKIHFQPIVELNQKSNYSDLWVLSFGRSNAKKRVLSHFLRQENQRATWMSWWATIDFALACLNSL